MASAHSSESFFTAIIGPRYELNHTPNTGEEYDSLEITGNNFPPIYKYSEDSQETLTDILFPHLEPHMDHSFNQRRFWERTGEVPVSEIPPMLCSEFIGNTLISQWRTIKGIIMEVADKRIVYLDDKLRFYHDRLDEAVQSVKDYLNTYERKEGETFDTGVFHRMSRQITIIENSIKQTQFLMDVIIRIRREVAENHSIAFVKLPVSSHLSFSNEPTPETHWKSLVDIMPSLFHPATNTERFDYYYLKAGSRRFLWDYTTPLMSHRLRNFTIGCIRNTIRLDYFSAYSSPPVSRYSGTGKRRASFGAYIRALDCIFTYLNPKILTEYFYQSIYPLLTPLLRQRFNEVREQRQQLYRDFQRRDDLEPGEGTIVSSGAHISLPEGLISTTETLPDGFEATEDDEDPVMYVPFQEGDVIHTVHCCGKRFHEDTLKSLFASAGRDMKCPMCRTPLIRLPEPVVPAVNVRYGYRVSFLPDVPLSSVMLSPDEMRELDRRRLAGESHDELAAWVQEREHLLEEEAIRTMSANNGRL